METTAQIDLSGISPLCDFPFTIISLFDVNSCKQSRGILRNHTAFGVSHATAMGVLPPQNLPCTGGTQKGRVLAVLWMLSVLSFHYQSTNAKARAYRHQLVLLRENPE